MIENVKEIYQFNHSFHWAKAPENAVDMSEFIAVCA